MLLDARFRGQDGGETADFFCEFPHSAPGAARNDSRSTEPVESFNSQTNR